MDVGHCMWVCFKIKLCYLVLIAKSATASSNTQVARTHQQQKYSNVRALSATFGTFIVYSLLSDKNSKAKNAI